MLLFQIVSCSGDGMIYYTDLDRHDMNDQHPFNCHFGTTYEVSELHMYILLQKCGIVREYIPYMMEDPVVIWSLYHIVSCLQMIG